MNLAWLKIRTAWQPLTFDGVAAFAGATFKRLLAVQLFFALLAAATVVWFLDNAWFPPIREAFLQMPGRGEIQSGKLNWTDETPRLLSENRFLAIISDLNHKGGIRVPAHIQVELGRADVRFISLFGQLEAPYPDRGWTLAFNRNELLAWWGAWRPPILWMSFGGVVGGLMLVWAGLATMGFLPVWMVGFFGNRRLGLGGSWRLAGAALMPGALLMTVAVLCYGFGLLDLVQLLAAGLAHFLAGPVYCAVSPLYEPKLAGVNAAPPNPFRTAPPPPAINPFAGKSGEDKSK